MSTELDKIMTKLNLTEKQMEFAEHYLRTYNASDSYRKT